MTAIAVCVQEREVDICSLCVGGGGGGGSKRGAIALKTGRPIPPSIISICL